MSRIFVWVVLRLIVSKGWHVGVAVAVGRVRS
jgi:hypothetical protein